MFLYASKMAAVVLVTPGIRTETSDVESDVEINTKSTIHEREMQWHRKYGPIIRVAPNSVNFTDPQAWKDIYGHRTGGRPATTKTVAVER